MKSKLLLVFVSIVLLTLGCSKDDGPEIVKPVQQKPTTAPPDATVLTGVFKDSEVQGLSYETTTQSGTTNDKGEFSYVEGESITFKIGNVTLGTLPAEALVTPVTIAQQIDAEARVSSSIAGNIAALLQTLDEDQDHRNGIEISAATAATLGVDEIDFTAPIESTLADIVLNVSQNNGSYLNTVYPHTAVKNMATSLEIDYEPSDNYTVTHFLPFLKSFYVSVFNRNTPPSAVHKNEFDGEGKLVSTDIILRYSGRTIYSLVYDGYADNGQPASGSLVFNYAGLPLGFGSYPPANENNVVFEIIFDSDNHVEVLDQFFNGSTFSNPISFEGYDDFNRPLSWSQEFRSDDGFVSDATFHTLTYDDTNLTTERVEYSYDFDDGESEYSSNSLNDYVYTIDGKGNYSGITNFSENSNTQRSGDEESFNNSTNDRELSFSYTESLTLESRTENNSSVFNGEPNSSTNIYGYDANEFIISSNFSRPSGFEQETSYDKGVRTTSKNYFNGILELETEYLVSGGEITSQFYYDENGGLFETLITEYNASYYRTKQTWLDADGQVTYVSFFNNVGLVTLSESYFEGAISSITEYEYDGSNRTLKSIYKDSEGNLISEDAYAYDQNGFLSSVERSDENGNLSFTFTYAYDADGQLSELATLDADGNLLRINFYEAGTFVRTEIYDGNGNLVEVIGNTTTAKRAVKGIKASAVDKSISLSSGVNTADATFDRTRAKFLSKSNIQKISDRNQRLMIELGRTSAASNRNEFR